MAEQLHEPGPTQIVVGDPDVEVAEDQTPEVDE